MYRGTFFSSIDLLALCLTMISVIIFTMLFPFSLWDHFIVSWLFSVWVSHHYHTLPFITVGSLQWGLVAVWVSISVLVFSSIYYCDIPSIRAGYSLCECLILIILFPSSLWDPFNELWLFSVWVSHIYYALPFITVGSLQWGLVAVCVSILSLLCSSLYHCGIPSMRAGCALCEYLIFIMLFPLSLLDPFNEGWLLSVWVSYLYYALPFITVGSLQWGLVVLCVSISYLLCFSLYHCWIPSMRTGCCLCEYLFFIMFFPLSLWDPFNEGWLCSVWVSHIYYAFPFITVGSLQWGLVALYVSISYLLSFSLYHCWIPSMRARCCLCEYLIFIMLFPLSLLDLFIVSWLCSVWVSHIYYALPFITIGSLQWGLVAVCVSILSLLCSSLYHCGIPSMRAGCALCEYLIFIMLFPLSPLDPFNEDWLLSVWVSHIYYVLPFITVGSLQWGLVAVCVSILSLLCSSLYHCWIPSMRAGCALCEYLIFSMLFPLSLWDLFNEDWLLSVWVSYLYYTLPFITVGSLQWALVVLCLSISYLLCSSLYHFWIHSMRASCCLCEYLIFIMLFPLSLWDPFNEGWLCSVWVSHIYYAFPFITVGSLQWGLVAVCVSILSLLSSSTYHCGISSIRAGCCLCEYLCFSILFHLSLWYPFNVGWLFSVCVSHPYYNLPFITVGSLQRGLIAVYVSISSLLYSSLYHIGIPSMKAGCCLSNVYEHFPHRHIFF